MPQIYNEELRKKIVRLHVQEGRTYKKLIDENGAETSAKNAKTPRLLKGTQKLCKDFKT